MRLYDKRLQLIPYMYHIHVYIVILLTHTIITNTIAIPMQYEQRARICYYYFYYGYYYMFEASVADDATNARAYDDAVVVAESDADVDDGVVDTYAIMMLMLTGEGVQLLCEAGEAANGAADDAGCCYYQYQRCMNSRGQGFTRPSRG
jgi:hypothetical protein